MNGPIKNKLKRDYSLKQIRAFMLHMFEKDLTFCCWQKNFKTPCFDCCSVWGILMNAANVEKCVRVTCLKLEKKYKNRKYYNP